VLSSAHLRRRITSVRIDPNPGHSRALPRFPTSEHIDRHSGLGRRDSFSGHSGEVEKPELVAKPGSDARPRASKFYHRGLLGAIRHIRGCSGLISICPYSSAAPYWVSLPDPPRWPPIAAMPMLIRYRLWSSASTFNASLYPFVDMSDEE
jgi:hypothetical protein